MQHHHQYNEEQMANRRAVLQFLNDWCAMHHYLHYAMLRHGLDLLPGIDQSQPNKLIAMVVADAAEANASSRLVYLKLDGTNITATPIDHPLEASAGYEFRSFQRLNPHNPAAAAAAAYAGQTERSFEQRMREGYPRGHDFQIKVCLARGLNGFELDCAEQALIALAFYAFGAEVVKNRSVAGKCLYVSNGVQADDLEGRYARIVIGHPGNLRGLLACFTAPPGRGFRDPDAAVFDGSLGKAPLLFQTLLGDTSVPFFNQFPAHTSDYGEPNCFKQASFDEILKAEARVASLSLAQDHKTVAILMTGYRRTLTLPFFREQDFIRTACGTVQVWRLPTLPRDEFVFVIPCIDAGLATSGRRNHHGRVLVCRIIAAIRAAVDMYLLHDSDGNEIQCLDEEMAILGKHRYDNSDEFAAIRGLCAELSTEFINARMKSVKRRSKDDEDGVEDGDMEGDEDGVEDTAEVIKPLTTSELQSLFHQQLKGRYSELEHADSLSEALTWMVGNIEDKFKITVAAKAVSLAMKLDSRFYMRTISQQCLLLAMAGPRKQQQIAGVELRKWELRNPELAADLDGEQKRRAVLDAKYQARVQKGNRDCSSSPLICLRCFEYANVKVTDPNKTGSNCVIHPRGRYSGGEPRRCLAKPSEPFELRILRDQFHDSNAGLQEAQRLNDLGEVHILSQFVHTLTVPLSVATPANLFQEFLTFVNGYQGQVFDKALLIKYATDRLQMDKTKRNNAAGQFWVTVRKEACAIGVEVQEKPSKRKAKAKAKDGEMEMKEEEEEDGEEKDIKKVRGEE